MQHGNAGLRFPGASRHSRPGGQRKHRRSKTDPMNTAVSSIPRTSVPNARATGHPQVGHRARRMSDSNTACASGKATGGRWESQRKSTARARTDEQACKSASCKSRTRIPQESLENASSSNHRVAVPTAATLPGTAPTISPPSSPSPSAWHHHPVQPSLYPGQCPCGNPTQLHTFQCPPSNPGHTVLPFQRLKSTEISCHAHTMQHRPKGQSELAVKTLPTATQLQGFVFRPATSTHTMTHPQTGPHGLRGNTGNTGAIPAQPKVEDFAPPTPHSDKTRKRTHSKMASELPLRLNDVESGVPLQSVSDNLLSLVHMMQHSLQESLRRLKGSGMYTVNRTMYATCSVLIHRRADVVKSKPLPISCGCDQSQICAWERMSQFFISHCMHLPAGSELEKEVESLERSQSQYHVQLASLCQQIGSREGLVDSRGLSTADWLAQMQQMELEKSHLLE